MTTLYPENRRGKEPSLPPDWTIFDPKQHEPPRGVIAALDDLAGWTAEAEGLSGSFGVSPALALWGEVGAFIEVAPAAVPGRIILRPPAPIAIPEGADMFELWVTGDDFDWQRKGALFSICLLAKSSAAKEETDVGLADPVVWPTYSTRIIKIPEKLRHAGSVTGIRLAGHDPARVRRFGLDRLCAYRDIRKPLLLAPRPGRPLKLPDGQSPGLHTGPGHLPFPTREQTILPDNFCTEFTTRIRREGDKFIFCYSGNDLEISYCWAPSEDPFRLAVQVNGRHAAEALADASLGSPEALADAGLGGPDAPEWWRWALATSEPLPPESLNALPAVLRWRGEVVPLCGKSDADGGEVPLPPYDAQSHGEMPFYHLFREIKAGRQLDFALELSVPKEHVVVWFNGTRVAPKPQEGKPANTAWNASWRLPLRPGKNLLAVRFIAWPTASFKLKRLVADAAWAGPWHVFGPSPHQPGAGPFFARRFPVQSLALDNENAVAVFDAGQLGPLTVRMQLWAKSMVVDCQCPSGAAAFFDPGQFRGISHGRVRVVPAMHSNAVLMADMGAQTLFFSHLHDWYRSNASAWTSRLGKTGGSASLQGPLYYLPKTDGCRNPLFERHFLTCSPIYEEVLPNIPNPPSPWAAEAGRYVFQESWGPILFDRELAKARRWAAMGMTGIMHLHHEAGWSYQDAATFSSAHTSRCGWVNDGCTLRLDISPHKGGNQAMQQFIAAEQALGLRAGLYTNYTDYYPLNTRFCSDRTILRPDGARQTAFVHSYKMKPSLAVEYDAWFAPRIAGRFHTDAAYTDVHTAIAPWDRVDYDDRVPGAGTFAATYYADGELLLNDQRHYAGPVFSEGGRCHWMYAGLVSGNYGQIGIKPDDPPDPAFNLLKVHPLETDVGLSVGTAGWIAGAENLDAQVDRYIMGVLTYGHIAYLPEEPFDVRLLLRVYHMARAASMRSAGLKPVGIHYRDGRDRWLSVSEAHARGLDAHCRLRIIYPGAMTFYANWSREQNWMVADVSEGEAVLPPNGYLLDTPRGVICASVLGKGGRCDRAQTPDGWYADGRGQEIAWGPLVVRGSAALLVDPSRPGLCRLVDGGGNEMFRIDKVCAPAFYRAIAPDNGVLSERRAAPFGAGAIIETVAGAVRYEWDRQVSP